MSELQSNQVVKVSKKRKFKASEIEWPTLKQKKVLLPSFGDEEIWHFLGERGVYSGRPEWLKYCFDIFEHFDGIFFYRMKHDFPHEMINDLKGEGGMDTQCELFPALLFHDSMEALMDRNTTLDNVGVLQTHDNETGEPFDELENWCDIPLTIFQTLKELKEKSETSFCLYDEIRTRI